MVEWSWQVDRASRWGVGWGSDGSWNPVTLDSAGSGFSTCVQVEGHQ